MRPEAELRHVGLADDDRARRPDALHEDRIRVRHQIGQRRALGGPQPLRGREILDGDGEAVQGSEPALSVHSVVRQIRFGQEVGSGPEGHDRIDSRVDGLDAVEEGRHDLPGRDLPARDPAGQLRRALPHQRGGVVNGGQG